MPESRVSSFPREVHTMALQAIKGDDDAYQKMVMTLAEECNARAHRGSHFSISVLRETCRQSLRDSGFDVPATLLFYKAFADAVVAAMRGAQMSEICRTGDRLQDMIRELQGRDPGLSLLLRLYHVAGLTPLEISTMAPVLGAPTILEELIAALSHELESRGLSKQTLAEQNIGERGELTLLLEKVRDGRQSLGDAVVHQERKLKRQASHLLRLEGGGISLEPEDLVNEMYLRLPKDAQKSPLNHREFDALAKRIMRHILIDRARRPLPTQSRFSTELNEDLAATSDTLDGRVRRQEVVRISDEVIRELRSSDPVTAEMLHATLYDEVDQKYLARVYGVSISTVKRRIKEGRDQIRQRLAPASLR